MGERICPECGEVVLKSGNTFCNARCSARYNGRLTNGPKPWRERQDFWQCGACGETVPVAEMATKYRCRPCATELHLERRRASFARSKEAFYERDRQTRLKNIDRYKAREKAWRDANKDKRRASMRKAKLKLAGLPEADYERLLESQGHACAICGATSHGREGDWPIDHDHACCDTYRSACGKCTRGLLCFNCNSGLGFFNDDPDRMRAAAAYIERYRKAHRS